MFRTLLLYYSLQNHLFSFSNNEEHYNRNSSNNKSAVNVQYPRPLKFLTFPHTFHFFPNSRTHPRRIQSSNPQRLQKKDTPTAEPIASLPTSSLRTVQRAHAPQLRANRAIFSLIKGENFPLPATSPTTSRFVRLISSASVGRSARFYLITARASKLAVSLSLASFSSSDAAAADVFPPFVFFFFFPLPLRREREREPRLRIFISRLCCRSRVYFSSNCI